MFFGSIVHSFGSEIHFEGFINLNQTESCSCFKGYLFLESETTTFMIVYYVFMAKSFSNIQTASFWVQNGSF